MEVENGSLEDEFRFQRGSFSTSRICWEKRIQFILVNPPPPPPLLHSLFFRFPGLDVAEILRIYTLKLLKMHPVKLIQATEKAGGKAVKFQSKRFHQVLCVRSAVS